MRFALLNLIRNAKNPENTYACLLSRKTQISAREFYEKQLKKPEHYYEQQAPATSQTVFLFTA